MVERGKLGKNSEIIQQQNRLLALQLIREKGVTSRIELASLTGLKQATITNIINELIEMDFVRETGLIEGKRGRRVKGITLNNEKMQIMVARITTHYFAAGLYDLNGECIQVEKVVWKENARPLQKLEEVCGHLLKISVENKKLVGAGIVFQGNEYTILSPLRTDIMEEHIDFLQEYFNQKLSTEVFIESMSNMSAYFAWNRLKRENRKNVSILVCLNISYSVDCAVISQGSLLRGADGMAGNYGHVSIDMNGPECECGNRGCINKYISVDAVKNCCGRLKAKYPDSVIGQDSDIREIIRAYYEEDALAMELYADIAEKTGVVLTNLINQFEPEELIIGDEIPNDERFLNWVKESVSRRTKEKYSTKTDIRIFQEERKTERDVGMRGMSLYIVDEMLKRLDLISKEREKAR